jgi:hypothetical protein
VEPSGFQLEPIIYGFGVGTHKRLRGPTSENEPSEKLVSRKFVFYAADLTRT